MTLTDDQVERYSRQVLLREVGGRGQTRLLQARVTVTGSGVAAAYAATLLRASGMNVDCADSADRLTVATGGGAGVVAHGSRVLTLAGRPCVRCATVNASSDDRPAAFDQAIGALAAGEAMRLVLGIATGGRVQTLDLDRGTFTAHALSETEGCVVCSASSRPA